MGNLSWQLNGSEWQLAVETLTSIVSRPSILLVIALRAARLSLLLSTLGPCIPKTRSYGLSSASTTLQQT